MTDIETVAVIGAGVMGAGIAAQIANAGIPVKLLDIVPEGAVNRNTIAQGAIEKLLKANPAPLMHARNARLITAGNIENNLEGLADCDWIIEAVIERLDIKQDLYRKLETVRKTGSIVSSNTSTIAINTLTEGMPENFAKDFLVTHFFNPPRYMRLLEIVTGDLTRRDAADTIRAFADVKLGKSCVDCNDTPGFIANRIGTYWLQCAVIDAIDNGVTIEEADAVIGRPMGIPNTGIFGLIDLVGLDLMPHILSGLSVTLPESDAFHAIYREPELIKKMIADGYTGRKGKGGFYRLNKEGGGRVKEAINLSTGEYKASERAKLKSVAAGNKKGLRAMVEFPDHTGQYGWRVISKTLAYAASLVPEIGEDVAAIDEAMRLGYNWRFGPFELIDKLGAGWFAQRLRADGLPVPPLLEVAEKTSIYRIHNGQQQYLGLDGAYRDLKRPDGVMMLSDIKLRSQPVEKNRSASLWDIGDGILCLEFHTKMNALGPGVLSMIRKAIGIIPGRYKGMVIYNESTNFSVGANIGLLWVLSLLRLSPIVGWVVGQGQQTYKQLKFSPFPVVAAPSGMALGGGCEILMHCDAVQANAETYTGLVEVGVGIIPGWGGCKELLTRWWTDPKRAKGPMPVVAKVFETTSMAKIAKSAVEARDYLFLRHSDGITMNRYRLLADAKTKALELVEGYAPPEPIEMTLPGSSARVGLEMAVDGFRKRGLATPHDVNVAGALAIVLSGGNTDIKDTVTEDDLLALEKRELVRLTRFPETIARVKHMLKTGRPLRN